jgi:hypothetical protein
MKRQELPIIYKQESEGCYIDGAVPRDPEEIVNRLLDLLPIEAEAPVITDDDWEDPEQIDWLIAELTEMLDWCTVAGLVWNWEAGDLCLIKEGEL